MSINEKQNITTTDVDNYIISSCCFAAHGISEIVANSEVINLDLLLKHSTNSVFDSSRNFIFYIQEQPIPLFMGIYSFAKIINMMTCKPSSITIITSCDNCWLWYTLSNLINDKSYLPIIQIVSSVLPVSTLYNYLNNARYFRHPNLKHKALHISLLNDKLSIGLTKAEFNVLLLSLLGGRINQLVNFFGLNNKTLYNQKKSAINKLIKNYPSLAHSFPGVKRKLSKGVEMSINKKFDEEFVHSIYSEDVFFVYQPITDRNLSLQGFELLCRWKKNNEIITPNCFLTRLQSDYAWVALTAYALNEAVHKINQYPYNFYFSVNLPTVMLENNNLIKMIELACKNLLKGKDSRRLVFEISELTIIKECGIAASNIRKLREKGFKVFLDDCFSCGSVFFPIRNMPLDGYKLDMEIVKDISNDDNALKLIKSLVFYCNLSGAQCIAEGVDNKKILSVLSTLGIDSFQGFLLSKPVMQEELIQLINKHP